MKFNLLFSFNNEGDFLVCDHVNFNNCETVDDVRSWLNSCQRFINIGEHLINLDRVNHVKISKAQ